MMQKLKWNQSQGLAGSRIFMLDQTINQQPTNAMLLYYVQNAVLVRSMSLQVMYDKPAEENKDNDSTPEDPFVLFRSSFHHSYRITTDSECICNTV